MSTNFPLHNYTYFMKYPGTRYKMVHPQRLFFFSTYTKPELLIDGECNDDPGFFRASRALYTSAVIAAIVCFLVQAFCRETVPALDTYEDVGILCNSRSEAKLKTAKLIKTLIVYAINRYILTTVVVFVQMVLIIAIPQNKGAMAMSSVTAHLKINSLLATLNTRNHLRRMVNHVTTDNDMVVNALAQLKTGSIVQFTFQSQLYSGSFNSGNQECSEDGHIVRIENVTEVDRGYSLDTANHVQKMTGTLV
ncbi:hypothetical protein K435DRAFT_838110 [Dendrothele bispora CBS 962.96]|uniref:DUF6534 domain-containing protein n=1 Tax=Dendrothele bispora (strain CBS 962.96) TaxID=1314807 RepID=A0A4S8M822_DENBC|nr:hypothetical protein K435DRAFT_838110 [Dendrothele bispora CBS 962.96]